MFSVRNFRLVCERTMIVCEIPKLGANALRYRAKFLDCVRNRRIECDRTQNGTIRMRTGRCQFFFNQSERMYSNYERTFNK